MQNNMDHLRLAVVENSKWIDKVLWTGVTLAILIVVLKLMGKNEFEWATITIQTSDAWIVFSLLSLAHVYTSIMLVTSVHKLWGDVPHEYRLTTFNTIIASGGIFVRGLLPSNKYFKNKFGLIIYIIHANDPTTWVAVSSILLLIAAIVPFNFTDLHSFSISVLVGLFIAGINWVVGSQWALALSDLSTIDIRSPYFNRLSKLYEKQMVEAININPWRIRSRGGIDSIVIPWFLAPFYYLITFVIFLLNTLIFLFVMIVVYIWTFLVYIPKLPSAIWRGAKKCYYSCINYAKKLFTKKSKNQ